MNLFPMNAKAAKDKFAKLMEDPRYFAQEKIDGVRALVYINREGKVQVTTRGESVDNPGVPIDITHRIPKVGDWKNIPAPLLGSLHDCEITIEGFDSAQVAGIVSYKSTVPVPDNLVFNVFGCLGSGGKSHLNKYEWDRSNLVLTIAGMGLYPSWMKAVPIYDGEKAKYELLDRLWDEGKEGIMLKNKMGIYQPGKRPANNWYKVKKVDSIDAKIIGAEPPEQYYRDPATNTVDLSRYTKPWANGWFGAIKYELEDGTVGTVSGFDDEEKEDMSDGQHGIKPQYIGQWIELKYMEKTKDGKLRHPRFIRFRGEVEK